MELFEKRQKLKFGKIQAAEQKPDEVEAIMDDVLSQDEEVEEDLDEEPVEDETEVDAAGAEGVNIGDEEEATGPAEESFTDSVSENDEPEVTSKKRKAKKRVKSQENLDDSSGAEDYATSDTSDEDYDDLNVETEEEGVSPQQASQDGSPYAAEGDTPETKKPATAKKKRIKSKRIKAQDEEDEDEGEEVEAVGNAGSPAKTSPEGLSEDSDSASDDSKQQMTAKKKKLAHLKRQAAHLDRQIETMESDPEVEADTLIDSEEDDFEEDLGEEPMDIDEGMDEGEEEMIEPEAIEDVEEEASLEEDEAEARSEFAGSIKSKVHPKIARARLKKRMAKIDARRQRLAKKILSSYKK